MRRKIIIDKHGEYIVETAISLPIFIIAVIVLCSIILMYSCIEDANFIAVTELRRASAESIIGYDSKSISNNISKRVKDNHSQVYGTEVVENAYRVKRWGYDELILVNILIKMNVKNPIELASYADYNITAVTRAYVGKERNNNSMTAAEFMNETEAVYIFPKRGEKYHSKGCGFLTAAYKSTVLTKNIKSKYSSCPICHSKNAKLGSTVYYFPNDGESYHLSGCSTLEKNYIEIEKVVAEERGYTACSKCGG